jgi:acyl carrier protein
VSVSSPSDVVVLDLIAKTVQVERDRLTPSTSFEELGLSSFQELELFTAIEDLFGVKLDLTQFLGFVAVSQLLASVSSALQETGLAEAGELR